MSEEKVCYTEEELAEFKEIIENKIESANKIYLYYNLKAILTILIMVQMILLQLLKLLKKGHLLCLRMRI